jgi:hypothetical protein
MVVRSKSQARSQTADATQLLGYGSVAGARALEGGEKSPRLGFLTLRCSRTKLRFSCCCPAHVSRSLYRAIGSPQGIRNRCEA